MLKILEGRSRLEGRVSSDDRGLKRVGENSTGFEGTKADMASTGSGGTLQHGVMTEAHGAGKPREGVAQVEIGFSVAHFDGLTHAACSDGGGEIGFEAKSTFGRKGQTRRLPHG